MDAITSWATVRHNEADPRTKGALYRNGCLGCDKTLRNPNHTLCAACAEDMGYARRAR
jgi:hypothetical protein